MPRTITDLRVENAADGVQLSWGRPRQYADGTHMTDLGGFVIERTGGIEPDSSFVRLDTVEVGDRDRFRQNPRFRYLDRGTVAGTAYRYRVVSFTVDRYFSAPSNVETIERIIPVEEKHAPLPSPQR